MKMSYFDKGLDSNRRLFNGIDDDSSFLRKSFRTTTSPPHRFSVETKDHGRMFRDLTDPDLTRHTSSHYYDPPRNSSAELLNLESKLASKEAKIQELERELRNRVEVEEHQHKTIKQLRDAVESFERDQSEFSTAHSKAQLAVGTLQSDNRQLQDRILELENRLRRQLEERELTGEKVVQYEKQYEELKYILNKVLFADSSIDVRSHDMMIRKLNDFLDNHSDMKSRIVKLEDNLAAAEHEIKQSRDSQKRVFDEFDRTKKYVASTDVLKEERDEAVRRHKLVEEEMKKLEKRLFESQDKYDQLQNEIRHQQIKVSDIDTQARRHVLSAQAVNQEFKSFKETLAVLLSDGLHPISPNEETIKEKIRMLIMNKQDVDKVTKSLEEKLHELAKQLEEQAHLHKNAVQRARKAEEEADKMKDRLKGAEGELVATDILKNGLKSDKHRYLDFLDQLSRVMKMDSITKELGMELNGDSLLARAEQLTKIEEELLGKRSSQLLTLQKQLQNTKKTLESKELHLDVLRKKLATNESENSYRAEKDWQEIMEKNHKLSRQVDKLQKQLNDTKRSVNGLKVENVTYEALKDTCEEQRKALSEMERRIVELEQVRVKQSRKIASLKQDKDMTESDAQQGFRVTESAVQSLSNEVQRLKGLLEEVQRREKQLLDLRTVIARMLGLDVSTLAVPDYEIISRLEKLIEAQHDLSLATRKMENELHHVDHSTSDAYKKAYMAEAQRRIGGSHRHHSASKHGRLWK